MQLVKACENVLGWTPPASMPLTTARTIAARRLGKEMAKDPERLTPRNLELAIELCRRQRQQIKSPLYLIYKVDEAVAAANVATAQSDIATLMEQAIAFEMDSDPSEEREYWLGRLVLARGRFRDEVYAEWAAARHVRRVA